ncbi:MAG TPA: DUF4384 domain-containing protein, partial [Spirochaetota bacterium]|nr:DUF4384 domain-containing protein [Spirochaetota bacterium]
TKGHILKVGNEQTSLYQKVQGFVSGSYWDLDKDNIEVKIKIYDIDKKEKIIDEMFTIKKNVFGNKMKFIPDNIDDFEKKYSDMANIFQNEEFNIRIWPNKGDNATYKDGEYLIPYFISNKDCYVRVYLIGADGNAMMVFPNFYNKNNFIQKNKIYKIGDPKFSSFLIELTKPYGCEMLVAVASSTEFQDKINFEKDVPIYDEKINLKGVIVKGVNGKENKSVTQASATYTIIPK